MELVEKYRPKTLKEVVGQPEVVKALEEKIRTDKIPQALMFAGPKGCGKTSMAQIIACHLLECEHKDLQRSWNYREINAAKERGIDMARDLENEMRASPMGAKYRVFLFDEVHELTKKQGGNAQSSLLTTIERAPKHVRILACTTNAGDLLGTFRDRFIQFVVTSLLRKEAIAFVQSILAKEKEDGSKFVPFGEDCIEAIVAASEGSPRLLTKNLEKVIGLDTDDARIELIHKPEIEASGRELGNCLLNIRSSWKDVSKLLEAMVEKLDAEGIRLQVLGHARTALLRNGSNVRAHKILSVMDEGCGHYGPQKTGHASLTRACWEILNDN